MGVCHGFMQEESTVPKSNNTVRKLAVFSSFSVRKRPVNDAILIDLGSYQQITLSSMI